MKSLHDNIKSIRIEKGLTRKELASRLSISYASLSKYETGERIPDITLVQHIARTLVVTLYDLLGDVDDLLLLNDIAFDQSRQELFYELNKKFMNLSYARQKIVMELIDELSK